MTEGWKTSETYYKCKVTRARILVVSGYKRILKDASLGSGNVLYRKYTEDKIVKAAF